MTTILVAFIIFAGKKVFGNNNKTPASNITTPITGTYVALMPKAAIIFNDPGFLSALNEAQAFLKFRNTETINSIKEIICFAILIENIGL